MSIESDRRAIGSRIEAERRAIGPRMEANRRAIGAGITASRTSTFKQDLNALETSPRKTVTLTQVEAVGARPATRGTAVWKEPAGVGRTAGIAGPLTETAYADRTHWPETVLVSTDGLLSFKVAPIKSLSMKDANNAPVVQQFAAPVVTP